jgi:hypothetical protein
MTGLTLELTTHEPLDLAFEAPRFVLWRRGTEVRLCLDDRDVARVRRALALRGVRATVVPGRVPEPPTLVRAIGVAMAPARLENEDLDVVDVRVVPLGEATARVLRRAVRLWPLGPRRRSRCRALLRRSDALFEIRRTAWCGRATLRAYRRTLRPALFDVGAASPLMRIYASERPLTRWIEG